MCKRVFQIDDFVPTDNIKWLQNDSQTSASANATALGNRIHVRSAGRAWSARFTKRKLQQRSTERRTPSWPAKNGHAAVEYGANADGAGQRDR